jgi:hypothetical protein
VTFILDQRIKTRLEQPPLKGVVRIIADVRPNFEGEDVLVLRVILKDEAALSRPSKKIGERLAKLAGELRQRAAKLGIPMFAAVDFVTESELPKRLKTA